MATTRKKLEALATKGRAEQLASLSDIDQRLLELNSDSRVSLLRKENKQLREKLKRRDSGMEIVKAAFDEAYASPLDIVIDKPPKQRPAKTSEEALLHLTDIHFGKETTTYNSAVAAERVVAACEATAEIVSLRRTFAEIKTLRLALGGDMVEGEGAIFPGQAHEIDQDLINQMIKFGPTHIANAILYLLQVFDSIAVDAVPGNHGRQGKFAAKRNNADSIFYEVVRLIVSVADPKSAARITWNLPLDRPAGEEWFANFKICGRWGGLLVHADQVRGQLGFPWYGYGKKVAGWASCLPTFDYLFGGHFHTHASFDLHDRQVMSTGSTESDNAYAKENMAAAGSPKQRLCFFNRKWGLLADHPIHLTQREPQR